jgi:hypothetical protein
LFNKRNDQAAIGVPGIASRCEKRKATQQHRSSHTGGLDQGEQQPPPVLDSRPAFDKRVRKEPTGEKNHGAKVSDKEIRGSYAQGIGNSQDDEGQPHLSAISATTLRRLYR